LSITCPQSPCFIYIFLLNYVTSTLSIPNFCIDLGAFLPLVCIECRQAEVISQ
jgi:hypothetical protein